VDREKDVNEKGEGKTKVSLKGLSNEKSNAVGSGGTCSEPHGHLHIFNGQG
jgi:hypothetical protein